MASNKNGVDKNGDKSVDFRPIYRSISKTIEDMQPVAMES